MPSICSKIVEGASKMKIALARISGLSQATRVVERAQTQGVGRGATTKREKETAVSRLADRT